MNLPSKRRFCDAAPLMIPAENGQSLKVSRDPHQPNGHVTLEICGNGSFTRAELSASAVGILLGQLSLT